MDKLSILYIGSHSGNSLRRFKAINDMCPNSDSINTDPYILNKFLESFQYHLNFGPGIYRLNKKVRKLVKQKKYDIIIVDNKPFLSIRTLRHIRKFHSSAKIVNIITDDPFGKYTHLWKTLKRTIALYDLFFVQRKVNINELKIRGAKRVELCYRSFDPTYNRPLKLSDLDREKYHNKIGFVGTYENVRASYIAFLIQNKIPVWVTGNGWTKGEYWDIIKPFYKGTSVYDDEYIKTINGMEIALHFLRQMNRDEQDSRTFEIAASNVFMIAERSVLHQELFKEDEEAVFFSSKEELLEKVRYYLTQPDERKRISLNGYNRCFTSGYYHESRMKNVIEHIISG